MKTYATISYSFQDDIKQSAYNVKMIIYIGLGYCYTFKTIRLSIFKIKYNL